MHPFFMTFMGKIVILNLIDVDISMHDGIDSKCANAFHTKLFYNVFPMTDNGCKSYIQLVCNFFIDKTLCNERQDLNLSVAK